VTITDLDKIDIVATRPDTRVVKLVISDHLIWEDISDHCRLIQNKLNTYIAFVESGQLGRLQGQYVPDSPEIVIQLVALHAPPSEAEEFLAQAKSFLANIGLQFEVKVTPHPVGQD
jgi:hypothetical protein